MLYQKFDLLIHVEDRQAYILEDPSKKVLSPELRQLVLDLADHSPFLGCPFGAKGEQRSQYLELRAICEDLRKRIMEMHGPGKIVVPVSKDFAYFLHIHMASETDESGYYRTYPNEDKLMMEAGEFIPLVTYPETATEPGTGAQ